MTYLSARRAHTFLRLALSLSPVLTACSDATSPNAAWAGDWSASGTRTTTCGGTATKTSLGGSVTIDAVGSSELTTMSAGCSVSWAIGTSDADGATSSGGSGCGDASTNALLPGTGSATLAGSTITLHQSATSGGCTVSDELTLTRVTKPEMMK